MTPQSPVRSPFSPADARALLAWHRQHARIYPWRQTRDEYHLAVTELMLVRTRADQVARVWPRFFAKYPSLASLAAAPETDIREILRPLGLRWRASRVVAFAHAAAADSHWVDRLPCLPGGGPYVAAAVDVGARGRGLLPVDVTIARVIARYWGLSPAGEARRNERVLDAAAAMGSRSRRFFHAWLDLAASTCLPARPLCDVCPLSRCQFRSGAVSESTARR